MRSHRLKGASFQPSSCNDKLSKVSRKLQYNGRYASHPKPPYVCSTYVSIEATCPKTCRFKDTGCYPQVGNAASSVRSLDEDAMYEGLTGPDVAKAEAELINQAWPKGVPQDGAQGGRDLRLHVSGETADTASAWALGIAASRWKGRGGGDVWTYTHNWRTIEPYDFGPISALASVETQEEAEEAIERGYTPAMVVTKFPADKAFLIPGTGMKVVPCPAQIRTSKCITCRLCFKPMPKGKLIGFQLHGFGANRMVKKLPTLGQMTMPWA